MAKIVDPVKWDYEADVVIIGAGNAGLPAAYTAIESGAKKVVVLELMSFCDSSLALVNVGPAFAGTDRQKEEGIEDSPEQYYKDGTERAKGSPELWRAFIDNHLESYYWLKQIGVKFGPLFSPPGHTRKRGFFINAPEVVRQMEKAAKDKGADIQFLHRAVRLITDKPSGRVLGVIVKDKDNKEANYKASRGVIIASGSFGRSKDMIEEYGPHFVDWVPTMGHGHMGDGLKMALAVGAGTKDLGHAVVGSFTIDAATKTGCIDFVGYAGGIFVNKFGKRFWDEGLRNSFYGMLSEAGMSQPDGDFWMIYDEKVKNNVRPGKFGKAKPLSAPTLDELAKLAGIDAKGLKATVEQYNKDMKTVGYDTVFDRRTLEGCGGTPYALENGPYYAIKAKGSISSFKGGIKINAKAQVLNQYDEVIPGLYAAGEATGGMWSAHGTYLPCTLVAACMTFGRIAGKNVAAENSWC